ncbi:hypothetical protein Micbo1qcDRAFT_236903 [Microdochium bolleyi]|uniref:Zn(2)-C6 fungal-type domain-containing protein n=1 Tax=Microdochium bolleyi TaxID=196109 RepID=A0A136IN15_9PEZI|nr:hypothetical protein Micbo1qcDRAFT_236903 [Microdochium bolleyi]
MRRRHKKSRLGCLTCKRRKIKCDEAKPHCGNCVQFDVTCDFAPSFPSPASAYTPSTASRRGRPRSDWASWAQQIAVSSATKPVPATDAHFAPLNVDDIEIYHNYITRAAATLVEPGEHNGLDLWREGVPRLGFQYPCILDLVLAFSAYHLARDRPPDEAARFSLTAEHHCTAALREATVLLREFDAPSSPALYIISVLVCFTALAQGPRPGNLFLVANDGQVPWLSLIKGVKLVVTMSGWSSVFSGPLAQYLPNPRPEGTWSEEKPRTPNVEAGSEDWRISLNSISDLVDLCAQPGSRTQYKAELKILEDCYETTFGKGHHATPDHTGKMQSVMMWIYRLEEPLVQGLQERDPVALILLSHFCVLLHTLRGFWFIRGWAQHVLNELLQQSEASRKWLAWPLQFIESSNREDSAPGHAGTNIVFGGNQTIA